MDLADQILTVDVADRSWRERAACLGADPDLFYVRRGTSTAEARAVCASCPVRVECLAYAVNHGEEFGIWGGLSAIKRRPIAREVKRRRERVVA